MAEGFLGGGRAFTVQACRRSGSASSATLNVFAQAVPGSSQKASLVEVSTPTEASKDLLQTLGLDQTEHAATSSPTGPATSTSCAAPASPIA